MDMLDNQVGTGAAEIRIPGEVTRDDGTIYLPRTPPRYCYSEEMEERVYQEWLECFDE